MNEKIVSAVIYPDRALVTREMKLDLKAGENRILFRNLPPTLYTDSIRVKGAGSVPFKIEGQEIRVEEKEKAAHETVLKLDEGLEAVNDELAFVEASEKIEQNQITLFERMVLRSGEPVPGFDYRRPQVSDVQALRRILNEQGMAVEHHLDTLQKEKQRLIMKRNQLLREQEDVRQARHLTLQHCEVSLSCAEGGQGTLRLSYLLPNASWLPYYEARLFFQEKELELASFAKIRQLTGENWEEVMLSLSSAAPSTGAALPEFKTWFIDLYEPVKRSRMVPSPVQFKAKKMEEEKEFDEMLEEPALEAAAELVSLDNSPVEEQSQGESASGQSLSSVSAKGLNVLFEIPEKGSIGSDGTFKKSAIDRKRFPVKIETLVFPRLAENAFIQVRSLQELAYPLLAGDVFVFHGSDYIGKSVLGKIVMPRDELKLFMGRDEEIKVKNLLLNRFQSKKGMLQNLTRIEYQYQTQIRSHKTSEVEIRVMDSLPVSSHSQVKVKLTDASPAQTHLSEQGVIEWIFSLKPGEEKEIRFSFSIDYPEDQTLYGI